MPPATSLQKNPQASWKLPFSCAELEGMLHAMLGSAGHGQSRAEICLLDDAAMAELHGQSFGYAAPTNIVSFPAGNALLPSAHEPGTGAPLLGWMALSADTLLRECLLYGQEPEEHCVRLLAHGLAHLLGHDHGPAMTALCESLEQAARAWLAESFPPDRP